MKCPNCGSEDIKIDWTFATLTTQWKDPLQYADDVVMSGEPYCADCGAELEREKIFSQN